MRAALLLLVGVCCAADAADELSFVNVGVIPAPIDEVWKLLATSEGYKALGPALAEVDLRVGGTIRSRYRADGTLGDAETIENLILASDEESLAMRRFFEAGNQQTIETLRRHFGAPAP